MDSFEYYSPTTLDETTQLLSKLPDYRLLAGGTDLLVQMRGVLSCAALVDIKHVPELMQLSIDESGCQLGASVPGVVINDHAAFAALYPGLHEAVDLIGSTQIQGRCSVGGNLCNASPAADTVPALIVNRARCQIVGPEGQREIAVEDFNLGPGQNCLGAGELLVSLVIPRPAPRTADAYLRFIPRTEMDIAVVGAAVSLCLNEEGECTDARVAIGAVAPTALRVEAAEQLLVGSKLEDEVLVKLSAAVSAAANPISDKRGTAEYRRKVVGVLAKRAAIIARERVLDK